MTATAQIGMAGQTPAVTVKSTNPERQKYLQLWDNPAYREVAPGEQLAMHFLTQAKPPRDAELIDFGAGTGRGALMLALLGALKVQMLDFAPNCLDAEVAEACKTQPERIKFMVCDLTKEVPVSAAYGYCTDVMEHIPPEKVKRVLRNILASAQHVFFGIATRPDVMGETIGEELHLTPIEFRLLAVLLNNHGKVLTQRQLLSQVWGPNAVEHSHYLRIYMGHLRQKLEADPARPRHLLTETGIGYRFML